MNASFWRGKRVLISGHTGFQGAWLALWLKSLGARPTGFSLAPPTQPSLYQLTGLEKEMESCQGDIRDIAALENCLSRCRPELIFHLAAQSLVRRSYQAPLETFSTNFLGTVHVLDAVRRSSDARVLVCVTSDKCYENLGKPQAYREEDRLGGRDPYSSSKAAAELAIEAYRQTYFSEPGSAAVASARAGNVIGGGDWAADRLVPDIMRSLMENSAVVLRHPGAIRPWQHVLEPLNGYLTLAEGLWDHRKEFSAAWNFGPPAQEAKPVSWIAERLAAFWGRSAGWEPADLAEAPHEDPYLTLDSSRAGAQLGWKTHLSLDATLEWIIEWYRAYAKGAAMREFSLKQIGAFQRMVDA